MIIGFGLLSAVLYCTMFLALFFLIPLLIAGAKKGFKTMALGAGVSALLISGFQIVLAVLLGEKSTTLNLLVLLPPLGMIAGLVFIAAPIAQRFSFITRAVLGGIIAALAALPSIFYLRTSPDLIVFLNEVFSQMAALMPSAVQDVEKFRVLMLQMVERGFGAMFFLFIFINAWVGARLSAIPVVLPVPQGAGSSEAPIVQFLPGRLSLAPQLQDYKVPTWMVWFLLVSWAVILLSRYVASPALNALAWNVALSFSVCYAVQGLAVLHVRLAHSRMAPAARFIVTMLLVLVAVGGPAGYAVAALLSLAGTLETWMPLRNIPKGEQP